MLLTVSVMLKNKTYLFLDRLKNSKGYPLTIFFIIYYYENKTAKKGSNQDIVMFLLKCIMNNIIKTDYYK